MLADGAAATADAAASHATAAVAAAARTTSAVAAAAVATAALAAAALRADQLQRSPDLAQPRHGAVRVRRRAVEQ